MNSELRIKSLLLTILLLFLCDMSSMANILQGIVLDSDKNPVEGALVSATSLETTAVICSTVTDETGAYLLDDCPERIVLTVEVFGFEPYSETIESISSLQSKKDVTLSPIQLDEVVVTAKSKPTITREGNKVVVSNLMNSPHAQGNDMYNFMRYVPGLKVPMFEGDITLRATGGGATVLLVNGKNIHIPMDAYLKNMRVENIERIEIVAHPMNEYKVADGLGVINIILKKRADEGTQYNLSLGDRQYSRNSQNGTFSISHTSKNTFMTAGVYANHVREKSTANGDYLFNNVDLHMAENSVMKNRMFMGTAYFNMDYSINARNTIGAQFSLSGLDSHTRYDGKTEYKKQASVPCDSVFNSKSDTHNPRKITGMSANVNYTLNIGDKGSSLNADFDYRMSRPFYVTENRYLRLAAPNFSDIERESTVYTDSKSHTNAYGVCVKYNHVFSPFTRLNSGVSFNWASARYSNKYDGNAEYLLWNDGLKNDIFDFDDHTLSAYSNISHAFGRKINLMAGIRLDVYEADGKQQGVNGNISRDDVTLLPSLNVLYMLSDNHVFSFNIGSAATQPAYYNLNPYKTYISNGIYRTGNPNLKPSNMYSLTLNYTFFEDYAFTAFLMKTKNTVGDMRRPDENGQIMIVPENIGKALYTALLLSADKSFFNDYLSLSAELSYTFRKVENKIPHAENKQSKNMFDADIDADVLLSKRNRWTLSGSYSYESEQLGTTYSYPENHSIGFSLRKRFDAATFSIGCSKILQGHDKRFYTQSNYSYTTWTKNYWNIYVSYSVTLGNKRTRNIEGRDNNRLREKMEKTTDIQ